MGFMSKAVVLSVEPNSIAQELGIEPGDRVISVDGQPLVDILDYKFFTATDEYVLEIEKKNGDVEVIEIENGDYEELGVSFENGLLDEAKMCHNRCVFCFVDQLPKGMRDTLYFKDDDYRLSALMGNYITLTNMTQGDVDRIIAMRLPRINVSVHAIDRNVRSKLLHHKNADVLPLMERFAQAGIHMDCQIVLCPGWNDGAVLDETITALAQLYPWVQSLSVVPVGLTKHRDKLPQIAMFDPVQAGRVIDQIEVHRNRLCGEVGTNFVFASDEFYAKSGYPLPTFESYEGFLQIENGVGLLASMIQEFQEAAAQGGKGASFPKQTLATGVSAAPYLAELVGRVTPQTQVVAIQNDFFGHTITVAGLLTGRDIIAQLKGRDLGERVLLPAVLLNYDGVLLDDVTPQQIAAALGTPVQIIETDGAALYGSLFG